jgi:5'-nucleotidase
MARVLITNDDGIDSPGLVALAVIADEQGHDVVVAAPSWDSSGASASLTAVLREDRLLLDRRVLEQLPSVEAFAVEAAPAFIVRAAITGAFGPPPHVVLSGINVGPNTGQAVLHSGTVGAALTAATAGRPAAAFSIGIDTPTHWETAARVVDVLLPIVLGAAGPLVLNVNVPNVPPDQLGEITAARLAATGVVQAILTEEGEGYVKLGYEPPGGVVEPGTDVALLAEGAATVTALLTTCEAGGVDVAELLAGGDGGSVVRSSGIARSR